MYPLHSALLLNGDYACVGLTPALMFELGVWGQRLSGRSRPISSGWIPRRLIVFSLVEHESRVVTSGPIAIRDNLSKSEIIFN